MTKSRRLPKLPHDDVLIPRSPPKQARFKLRPPIKRPLRFQKRCLNGVEETYSMHITTEQQSRFDYRNEMIGKKQLLFIVDDLKSPKSETMKILQTPDWMLREEYWNLMGKGEHSGACIMLKSVCARATEALKRGDIQEVNAIRNSKDPVITLRYYASHDDWHRNIMTDYTMLASRLVYLVEAGNIRVAFDVSRTCGNASCFNFRHAKLEDTDEIEARQACHDCFRDGKDPINCTDVPSCSHSLHELPVVVPWRRVDAHGRV